MCHTLGPRRRLLAAGFGLQRLAPVLAPLFLLLQVLALEALAELAAVDPRPLLVERVVLAPAEVEFAPVPLSGRDDRMHVHVPAVAVERVDDVSLRQRLALVLRDHLPDFLVTHLFVEGVDQPVEGALPAAILPNAFPALLKFILLQLTEELDEVGAPLLVRHRVTAVDVLRHVLCPEVLVLAPGGDQARVVVHALSALARGPDCDLEADAAHPLSVSPTSPTRRATSAITRSNSVLRCLPPSEFIAREIWLTLRPMRRTSKSRRSMRSRSALTIISPSRRPRFDQILRERLEAEARRALVQKLELIRGGADGDVLALALSPPPLLFEEVPLLAHSLKVTAPCVSCKSRLANGRIIFVCRPLPP